MSTVDIFSDIIPYEFIITPGIIAYNFFEARSFLAAIISVERTLATTTPIYFYNYRKTISNFPIYIFLITTSIVCNTVLFKVCNFQFERVDGCASFYCSLTTCFQSYAVITRIIYTSTNIVFSTILSIQLIFLSCKSTKISSDLQKANLLSLTDAISTFIFDLLPSLIINVRHIEIKVRDS